MMHNDGNPSPQPEKGSNIVTMALISVVLCSFSFFLGGSFCSQNQIFLLTKDFSNALTSPRETVLSSLQLNSTSFAECSPDLQDYTPCTDPKRWRRYRSHRLSYLERHCPPKHEKKECLVPPPEGYKLSIKWPNSRNECWYRNVPFDWILKKKSNQHWLRKEGEKFIFPGGGTMFPYGVSHYVDLMQNLIPAMKDGTIRTAIDTGDLLDRGILTVSLAPRDNHQAQVQFALERGIPAILGIISTQRLPFPSSSFDMAHCSRCLIPWTEFGGIYLLEIQRILRPGGFWILSGPPVNYEHRWRGWNTTIKEQKSNYEKLEELLLSVCFKPYNQKDDIAVWQKSSDGSCYNDLVSSNNNNNLNNNNNNSNIHQPDCDDGTEPDSAWYTPLRPCIVQNEQTDKKVALESLPKWPQRLHTPPERVTNVRGGSGGAFKLDDSKWKARVKHYKLLLPALGSDEIRNVMDMNTMYGGFAAALIDDPVWVMNVVSSYDKNTLPVVFDRGLIGTYHDWCEAFSTYPRTYDLLHLDGLFTAESHRCEMKYVMLEMDRVLRPNGYALIRESNYYIDYLMTMAEGMRWSCRKADTESTVDKEKVMLCQKKLWYSGQI